MSETHSGEQHSSRAVTALAILGAVAWSLQLVPQIWLNYKRSSTEGLHSSMMILWAAAGLPLGIHNILSHQHIALQVQAQILTGLSLITWSQTMHYGKGWSKLRSILVTGGLMLGFAGIEAAFVVGFKYGRVSSQTREHFILGSAIIAAVGLSLGVLRHYLDIYKERTVRGISWGFVFLDAFGDLTSLLAIVLRSPLDPYATGIYASELALWVGIMTAGLVYNGIPALQRRFGKHSSATDGIPDAESPPSVRSDSVRSEMSAFRAIRTEIRSLPRYRMQARRA